MKITEIIEILRKDNTSYLWDLPRPQWKQLDFYNLNQIKEGKEYKNKNKLIDYVELSDRSLSMQQAQTHRMKQIRRISDGKIFDGVNQCCRETGINRANLSKALNNLPNASGKLMKEYEFIR